MELHLIQYIPVLKKPFFPVKNWHKSTIHLSIYMYLKHEKKWLIVTKNMDYTQLNILIKLITSLRIKYDVLMAVGSRKTRCEC